MVKFYINTHKYVYIYKMSSEGKGLQEEEFLFIIIS